MRYLFKTILLLLCSVTQAERFEQFFKNTNSQRTGLEFHNGQYGEYVNSNQQLVNPISTSDTTPLNRWFQWGIHNAYEKKNTSLFDILRDKTTDIEIDIHAKESYLGWRKYTKDWRVMHETNDTESNCLLHTGSTSTENYLSQCLNTIKQFHDAYPDHHVITVWLSLKGTAFPSMTDSYRSPATLDQLLEQHLGDILYSPADLKGNYSSVREAAANQWPTLGELKGKVMFVLYQSSDGNNDELHDYVSNRGDNASAFVGPRIFGNSVDQPKDFSSITKKHVVFYCLNKNDHLQHSHGPNIMRLGRISMTYGVDNNDTPATGEYRDFFVQRGRGDGDSSGLNPKWTYSGRLNQPDFGSTRLPAVAKLATGPISSTFPSGQYCLDIEGSSLSNRADVIHSTCTNKSSQNFALIDVAIDSDSNNFPLKRGYIVRAVHNTSSKPNQKILEVQGSCCGNNNYGREVFQYSRHNIGSKNRPDDQYWYISSLSDGIQLKNANANFCLSTDTTWSYLGLCNYTTLGRYFRPTQAPSIDVSAPPPPPPPIDICDIREGLICP